MRDAIVRRALAMIFVTGMLVGNGVNCQEIQSQSETQNATLFSRIKYESQDRGRSAFDFQHGVRCDDKSRGQNTRNYYHLLYGYISINGDSDWFDVSGGEDSNRIKDLGALQWSEVYFTPFLPANPHLSSSIRVPGRGETYESSSDQRVTKVIVGHMYVVHIKNNVTDLYAMFRVDELVPSDHCSISSKVMPSPEVYDKRGASVWQYVEF